MQDDRESRATDCGEQAEVLHPLPTHDDPVAEADHRGEVVGRERLDHKRTSGEVAHLGELVRRAG